MRKLLICLLFMLCGLCQVVSSSTILDLPQYAQWRKDMLAKIDTVFESLVPENERDGWKFDSPPFVGEIGTLAISIWLPRGELSDKWTEHLYCSFLCKPHKKEKRQYSSIDEFLENYTKRFGKDAEFKITRVNDKEAIIEKLTTKGTVRNVERAILMGDWLISMEYELNQLRDPGKGKNWDQNRDLWLRRFSQVQFN